MTFSLSVPGNLLLAGEYAVLEPGGIGIAIAVERRVRVQVREAAGLEIVGSWGGSPVSWRPDERQTGPLVDAVVGVACDPADLPGVRINVDSRAFFDAAGRKIGFGSSASVAVGLTAALLRAARQALPPREDVFRVALRAHRAFQGGHGSGYDVATSLHGGTGLFTGGEIPTWGAVRLPWLAGALVFRGARSVRTSGATARYRTWKAADLAAAGRFAADSDQAVRALLAARDHASWRTAFERARDVGLGLGESIGVGAAIDPPEDLRRCDGVWKALGAGNEIGLFLPDDPAARRAGGSAAEPLAIASEGLTWSE